MRFRCRVAEAAEASLLEASQERMRLTELCKEAERLANIDLNAVMVGILGASFG